MLDAYEVFWKILQQKGWILDLIKDFNFLCQCWFLLSLYASCFYTYVIFLNFQSKLCLIFYLILYLQALLLSDSDRDLLSSMQILRGQINQTLYSPKFIKDKMMRFMYHCHEYFGRTKMANWKFKQGALLNLAYTGKCNAEFQIVLDNDLVLICWSLAFFSALS